MRKLWLVSREVWADSLEKALKGKGRVYAISEADPAKYAEPNKNLVGFKPRSSK